ncbi:CGNR zinc finger domain-containing protein [Actinoplanes bogorensis]|uniref:CGNR zinc finger domain-containing protein n=1 Tax=Paractinoplanes bogorensis TaxID=1610840 RepID=A0ABS5YG33_9ACTN|nr:CGNR zinc finger domain-containing protein [Actinoplanes bogorensis]MBU2662405.1 CGNR zinc finger domain-containing protein [Actinoplanes bogorensis]
MPISANARYGVVAAPGGLELVQELLNTCARGITQRTADLLDDAGTAQEWADGMLDRLGVPRAAVTPVDIAALRELRDALRETLHGRPVPVAEEITVEVGGDGLVAYGGKGRPSARIRGAVLAEVLLAQARGEWPRFKLCQFPPCDLAFYDGSRNRSARWHDERCGNYVNLITSRERRRRSS